MVNLLIVAFIASCSATPGPAAPSPERPALTHEPRSGLDYLVRTSAGAAPDAPLPMLIALHGMADEPARFAGTFEGLRVPARLVLPQGPAPYPGGGRDWFAFEAGVPDHQGAATRMGPVGTRLAIFVEAVRDAWPTTGAPVLTGFSEGAMLCVDLWLNRRVDLHRALPVAGLLPDPLIPAPLPGPGELAPLSAFHGADDEVMPLGPARALIVRLQEQGAPVELFVYDGLGHDIDERLGRDLERRIERALQDASTAAPP